MKNGKSPKFGPGRATGKNAHDWSNLLDTYVHEHDLSAWREYLMPGPWKIGG
jgi:hypothetical protein